MVFTPTSTWVQSRTLLTAITILKFPLTAAQAWNWLNATLKSSAMQSTLMVTTLMVLLQVLGMKELSPVMMLVL